MADIAVTARQAGGKLRRFFEAELRLVDTEALLARRQGDCSRCGACCKIVFRCPFLSTDAEGNYTCRVYQYRFNACRQFPLRPADLVGLEEQCSYSFASAPVAAAVPPTMALEE